MLYCSNCSRAIAKETPNNKYKINIITIMGKVKSKSLKVK